MRGARAAAPRRLAIWAAGPLAIFTFWLLIVVTTASALAIAFVIYFHRTAPTGGDALTTSLLARIFSERWILRLTSVVDVVLWTLTGIGAAGVGGPWLWKF